MSNLRYEYNGLVYKASIEPIISACYDRDVYLYGYGLYGHFMENQLKKRGISVSGIIVSNQKYKEELLDKSYDYQIYVIEEFKYNDNIVVIICGNKINAKEMVENLKNRGIEEFYKLNLEVVDKQIKPIKGEFSKEDCYSSLKDATIRLRITNRCPGKCDFCGQKSWPEDFQNMEMDPKIYFEYLKPIYDQIKMILITGGDAFFARNSYEYMDYISKQYPHITIMTESNGLTFSDRFQKLACENLFSTHFSINASNKKTFLRGCWSSEGGDRAWDIIESNIKSYTEKLNKEGKICFAPSVSMVVNIETADDVAEFVEYSLRNDYRRIRFYFDYEVNDLTTDDFGNADVFQPALIKLLELKRMLKDYFLIDISWVPFKEMDCAENAISNVSDELLKEKYRAIWEYGSRRNVIREYKERECFREKYGKKSMSFVEDTNTCLRSASISGKRICYAPWSFMDIWPDGSIDICGWRGPAFFIQDYIKGDIVDWMDFFNTEDIRTLRANMLNGCYENCLPCCPVIREVL